MNPVVLHVDLTNQTFEEVDIPQRYIDDYIGGRGLGIRLLHDWVDPATDPLAPEAAVMFMTGPLHGAKAFYSSKTTNGSSSRRKPTA